jgi:hypothetical protein
VLDQRSYQKLMRFVMTYVLPRQNSDTKKGLGIPRLALTNIQLKVALEALIAA